MTKRTWPRCKGRGEEGDFEEKKVKKEKDVAIDAEKELGDAALENFIFMKK